MTNYYMLLTPVGLAKVTNAQLTQEKVEITQVAIGDADGKPYSPTGKETALKREVWRGGVDSIEVDAQNPNWIVVEAIIPSSVGGFMMREVALYDAAGDMIAIGNYPENYKPVMSDGSTMDLALRTIIEVNNAESVTLKIDPNVIVASRAYVDNKMIALDERVTKHLAQITDLKSYELNSKGRKKGAYVVFISDDATRADYEVVFPLFREEGAPLCLAAISSYTSVNTVSNSLFMSVPQCKEVEEAGGEILGHSVTHPTLPETLIPQMSDEDAEAQYRDCIADLRAKGLNVQSYATVGGQFNTRERLLARKYYRAARTSDYGKDGLNHAPIFTHELKSIWLDEVWGITDYDFFKQHIDAAVEHDALLIISTHASGLVSESAQETMRQVIRYAKANAEVVTLREALDAMGNVVESGDYTEYDKGNVRGPAADYYVVGCDGSIKSSDTKVTRELPRNAVSTSTPYKDFEAGTTKCVIDTNTPSGGVGTLITHRLENGNSYGLSYQEFVPFNLALNPSVYYRSFRDDTTFGDWIRIGSVVRGTTFDMSSGYQAYPTGITMADITTTDTPSGTQGTLITYKSSSESFGKSYQEFVPFNNRRKFKRHFTGDVTFSGWAEIGIKDTSDNTYTLTTPYTTFPMGITYTDITDTANSPSGTAGTLKTTKVNTNAIGRNYQEFRPHNSPKVYHRNFAGDSTFGAWALVQDAITS